MAHPNITRDHVEVAITFLVAARKRNDPPALTGRDVTCVLEELGLTRVEAVVALGRAVKVLARTPDPLEA